MQHEIGMSLLIARHGRRGANPVKDPPVFKVWFDGYGAMYLYIQAEEILSTDSHVDLSKYERVGRFSGGIEWVVGNALHNALADGLVECEKFDAYYGPVWHRAGAMAFGVMADEVEFNPDIDVDRVLRSMKVALGRREYLVKIGLKIPRRQP